MIWVHFYEAIRVVRMPVKITAGVYKDEDDMAQASKDDRFRAIKAAAIEQGWVVKETTKRHWKFVPPNPAVPPVVFSGSPGDWRAIRNFVAAMRRSGLQIPAGMRKGGH